MDAFTYLDSRKLSDKKYNLLSDLVYHDKVLGPIIASTGFVTNYASIGVLKNVFLFILYALLVKYGDKASVIHDWLYAGHGIRQADGTYWHPPRKVCDQIFYRALRAEGVARWRAWIFYIGVRIGGRGRYSAKLVRFNG